MAELQAEDMAVEATAGDTEGPQTATALRLVAAMVEAAMVATESQGALRLQEDTMGHRLGPILSVFSPVFLRYQSPKCDLGSGLGSLRWTQTDPARSAFMNSVNDHVSIVFVCAEATTFLAEKALINGDWTRKSH